MSLTGSASMTNELQGSVESGGEVRGKLAGLRFIQGLSAYEVAVVEGFSGTEAEWLASLKGKDGVVGADGYTPQKGVDYVDGVDGKDGVDGTSIQSIERTSGNGAPGTTDTYTVTLTDGSTTAFQVYNGADGTMRFEDLTDAQKESLRGPVGLPGNDGVGIRSIEQVSSSSASGARNTIRVRMEDGRSYDFTVWNGAKGEDGQRGAQGLPGKDGYDGDDATINGVNALTISAGDGIDATMSGSTLIIKAKTVEEWTFTLEDDSTVTKKVVLV